MCNVCQACKLPLIIAMFFCMTNIHILFRKLSSKILHFESNTFKKCHWTHLFELPEVTWAAACLFVVDNTKNLKLDLSHGRRQMLCSNSHHPHTDPHYFIIETALPLTWPTAISCTGLLYCSQMPGGPTTNVAFAIFHTHYQMYQERGILRATFMSGVSDIFNGLSQLRTYWK